MKDSLTFIELYTANSAKKDIWINSTKASGEMITIDRRYLSKILSNLECSQYNKGYSDGYTHRDLAQNDKLPIDLNFKDCTEEW